MLPIIDGGTRSQQLFDIDSNLFIATMALLTRNWYTPLVLLVIIGLALSACDESAPTEPEAPDDPEAPGGPDEVTLTVEGKVVDARSGGPVGSANVSIFPEGEGSVLDEAATAEDGRYTLSFTVEEGEVPDELRLKADADDYVAYETILGVTGEGASVTHDVELEATTTAATLTGTVTDEETGDGIEAATVTGIDTATKDKLFEVEVDTFGEYEAGFEVDEVPAEVTVKAMGDGYEAAEETISFADTMEVSLTLSLGKGKVYTASSDDEAHKLTPEGEEVWRYTGHSSSVNGVAVDSDGYVYTASGDGEFHKLTPEGEEMWSYLPEPYPDPASDVAVDSDGHVYTASGSNASKLTPEGETMWTYMEYVTAVYAVAVDANGHVYTASGSNASKLTPEGEEVWRYIHSYGIGASSVYDIAVDADGYVYIASSDGEALKLTPEGEEIWRYTGHSGSVNGIAVDADGYVYTASYDSQVHKLTPEGEEMWRYTHSYGIEPPSVDDVAVDADGYVYTASYDSGTPSVPGQDFEIHKLTPGGEKVWHYTGHSYRMNGVAVFPGDFSVSQELVD